jgi:uncharacterized protein YneF (UPF0154 family)
MKTRRLIITVGIVSLLLGVAIGFFTAGRITKRKIHRMVEMKKPPMFKYNLEDKLQLSPEQQEDFDRVFHEHMGRMRQIDQNARKQTVQEFEQLFNELNEGLDETQSKKLQRFKKRFIERHKRAPRRGKRPPRHR